MDGEASWNNTPPRGWSYRDHLRKDHPKTFLGTVSSLGSKAETHPSLACLFDFAGFPFVINRELARDTAVIGGTLLRVENL